MPNLLNEKERSQVFQKMGFWEQDLKKRLDVKKKIYPITLSCGQCKDSVLADDCEIVESEIKDSHRFTKKIELMCPDCQSVLIGGCI